MIVKRLTTDAHGEQVLTITVRGATDIFRFARFMEHGQVEFADQGRKTLRSLGRAIGRARFRALIQGMEGGFPTPDWTRRYFGEATHDQ